MRSGALNDYSSIVLVIISVSKTLEKTTGVFSAITMKFLQLRSILKRGGSFDSNDIINIVFLVFNRSVKNLQLLGAYIISPKLKRDLSSQHLLAKYTIGFLQWLQLAKHGNDWLHNHQIAAL